MGRWERIFNLDNSTTANLNPTDVAMNHLDVFYARYMDDWIILSKTRWKLKRAGRICNQILDKLKVEKHPFKTFFGRVSYGFDFLGYRLTKDGVRGVGIAWKKVINHLEKIVRLHEQDAGKERIGQYLKGWWQWVRSGVELRGGTGVDLGDLSRLKI